VAINRKHLAQLTPGAVDASLRRAREQTVAAIRKAQEIASARNGYRDTALDESFTLEDLVQANRAAVERQHERDAEASQAEASTGRKAQRGTAKPVPPLTNRGIKVPTHPPVEIAARLVIENGEVLEIPARRAVDGGAAIIDWLQFTVHEESFRLWRQGITDDDVMIEASALCEWIFGFGLTAQKERGMFFYEKTYVLGDDYGMVCIGGERQRQTVLFSLTGKGCAAASQAWEKRLYHFFTGGIAVRPNITRVDLAHDDYTGEGIYTVDAVKGMFERGWFDAGGRPPACEMKGDWLRPAGKGRSFYVGSRKSGKLMRCYEKGMELGALWHPWVRVEVELRSHQREIPFDVLLSPAQYLAGAYPALAFISEAQVRVETTKRAATIQYDKAVEWFKKTAGHYLWVFAEIEGGLDKLLQKCGRVGDFPKRLIVPTWDTARRCLHDPDMAFSI
jgi:phage replication initiation protein